MFGPLENLVQSLRGALTHLGCRPVVRTVYEQWEGTASPHVEVIISVGRDSAVQAAPVADVYLYPVRGQVCEIEVEVTLPAHTVQMQAAQLWAKAKEISGVEVGISGIQRYFRGEQGKTVHIHLESHFIIDYWFELEVPEDGEASDEDWESFDAEVAALAQGLVGLLSLGEVSGAEEGRK